MILEQHCQVNSNFFYSEKLEVKVPNNIYNVVLRNETNDYGEIIETIIFGNDKTAFIHMETNKGEFILLPVTSDINKEQILTYLKENSSKYPTYYFRNVDYFDYGTFGYAQNGKIERYLAYNSEAMQGENIVEWIGKPHKWEYDTHTFYTKKKLENCEMRFNSDTVCEMIYYYLPFINDDLQIQDFTIYSSNKEYIKRIKKARKYKYEKVQKDTYNKIYQTMTKHNLKCLVITALIYNDKVTINNLTLYPIKDNCKDILENEILFCNLISQTEYNIRLGEINFHNGLIQLADAIPTAEVKTLREIAGYIKQLEIEKKKYFICIYLINKRKYKLELLEDGDNGKRYFIGYNFTKKNSNKIYQLLKEASNENFIK